MDPGKRGEDWHHSGPQTGRVLGVILDGNSLGCGILKAGNMRGGHQSANIACSRVCKQAAGQGMCGMDM